MTSFHWTILPWLPYLLFYSLGASLLHSLKTRYPPLQNPTWSGEGTFKPWGFTLKKSFYKKSSSERCCYIRLVLTDLLYANSKDLSWSRRISIRIASLTFSIFSVFVGCGYGLTYILSHHCVIYQLFSFRLWDGPEFRL